MGRGIFESDEDYRSRISQEANERIVEESTGSTPSKGIFESDEDYRSRINEEACERIIEDSTGSTPSKGIFESDEDYHSRVSEEAHERIIEDSTGSTPSKGIFESDEDYHSRVSEEANERIIEDFTGSTPSKGVFEADGDYRRRIGLEAREQRAKGRTAAIRDGDRASDFSYDGESPTRDRERHKPALAWLGIPVILVLVWAVWNSPSMLQHPSRQDSSHGSHKIELSEPQTTPTKFIQRDPETGLVTIEATADGFGTSESDWFTIITGGTDQRTFLHRGFPNLRIGERLRLIYGPKVPERLQGPIGTAAYMDGVIVSMNVIGIDYR
jgi:hypothetical protein